MNGINNSFDKINQAVKASWSKIAPCWPLQNIIAVNPLQGLQDLPIEQALQEAALLFESQEIPKEIENINIQTIKWLQAFLNQGQATINMPQRTFGFYRAFKALAVYDDQLHHDDAIKKEWIAKLPDCPKTAIQITLEKLAISDQNLNLFFTLMLTTLPGWASYIKYRTNWTDAEPINPYPITEEEYSAVRIIITSLLWQNGAELIHWYKNIPADTTQPKNTLTTLNNNEKKYIAPLLKSLNLTQNLTEACNIQAQFVFCIDVRSEPFRRLLELKGPYQTFGFAGFFGIPVRIKDTTTATSYASCPVLLKPEHTISQIPIAGQNCNNRSYFKLPTIDRCKALYQSLKYNMPTSFGLIELIGFPVSIWMSLQTLTPLLANKLKTLITNIIQPACALTPCLENLALADQCMYAESALKGIGLINKFAPIIVLCGHASTSENNAYATALDCGACGGHQGGPNAKILAKILNTHAVRDYLKNKNIEIPNTTHFIAAEHNTTTNQVEIYTAESNDMQLWQQVQNLKMVLAKIADVHNQEQAKTLEINNNKDQATQKIKLQSVDWSTVRPEWGLAGNAAFIIAPRAITQGINLDGRAFLHSYNYLDDPDGSILKLILTAPMIVAQWINSQYLFSTLNNVTYGSGSKITQNITGKFGIMQGNASDLMSGLPLQSVNKTEKIWYHQPVRLTTIIYASCDFIDTIIQQQPMLQTLFANGWVLLISIDPNNTQHHYFLDRDLTWKKYQHE